VAVFYDLTTRTQSKSSYTTSVDSTVTTRGSGRDSGARSCCDIASRQLPPSPGRGGLPSLLVVTSRRNYVAWEPRTVPRPPMRARVRLADQDDAARAAPLALTVAHGDLDEWRQRLKRDVSEPDRWLFVAANGRCVVGYCRLSMVRSACQAPDGYYLVGLVVAEGSRRTGIAEGLVSAATQQARQVADALWSFYDVDYRPSAALHTRLGFLEQSRGRIGFPGLPEDDRHVLVRRSFTGPE